MNNDATTSMKDSPNHCLTKFKTKLMREEELMDGLKERRLAPSHEFLSSNLEASSPPWKAWHEEAPPMCFEDLNGHQHGLIKSE